MENADELVEMFQVFVGLLAPVFIPLMLFAWHKRAVILWFVIYVGIYLVLSLNGRYMSYIGGGSDGGLEWYAWGTANRRPSNGGRIKSGSSPLGFFFLLPATLDGDFWHLPISGEDPRAPYYWNQEINYANHR